MKSIKGITLIALVITIIILIILSAVGIYLSLGENGIFKKAKYATEEYVNEQAREELEIGKMTNELESHVGGSRETVTIPKEEYEKLKSDVATMNSGFQEETGIISMPTKGQKTLKEFTNLEPGLYFVSYTQAIPIGDAGSIFVFLNETANFGNASTRYNNSYNARPYLHCSGVINVTTKTDVISLQYQNNIITTTQDIYYYWQIMRLK